MKKAIAKINELSREDWLTLRKKGIGGSDAAAVCALNRWRGPLDVFLDKTSESIDSTDNEAMYWGRVMEPVLREEFSRRTNLKVEAVPYMFQFKEHPFMLANIDGIVHENDGTVSLIEIKTANGFATKDWEDGLPQEYYIQIQHYLAVCDLAKAYVAVLIGGNNFRYEAISRDDETIRTIIALESNFWNNHVLTKTAPPLDSTSEKAISSMYPASNGTSIILPSEADRMIANIEECRTIEEEIKKAKAEAENGLKALLQDAECGKTPSGYSVRWKTSTTSRLDSAKLKADHPDLVAQYTKASSYRRFSITAPKA
ncbi:MAG: YqaJ viral recombinase family protein [Selenomonadaceae bacterium]|nr:YqaJ viral recombinase family protein [Selenomonadaceae bacterium]